MPCFIAIGNCIRFADRPQLLIIVSSYDHIGSRGSKQRVQTTATGEIASAVGTRGFGEVGVPSISDIRVGVASSSAITILDNLAYSVFSKIFTKYRWYISNMKEFLTLGQTWSMTPTFGSILSIVIKSPFRVSGLSTAFS